MKKIIFFSLLMILGISLCGCAELIAESCTPSAAYNSGVNDAQNYRDMQQNYAVLCPAENQTRLNRSYRRGYRYGMRHRKPHWYPPHHWHHWHHRRHPWH